MTPEKSNKIKKLKELAKLVVDQQSKKKWREAELTCEKIIEICDEIGDNPGKYQALSWITKMRQITGDILGAQAFGNRAIDVLSSITLEEWTKAFDSETSIVIMTSEDYSLGPKASYECTLKGSKEWVKLLIYDRPRNAALEKVGLIIISVTMLCVILGFALRAFEIIKINAIVVGVVAVCNSLLFLGVVWGYMGFQTLLSDLITREERIWLLWLFLQFFPVAILYWMQESHGYTANSMAIGVYSACYVIGYLIGAGLGAHTLSRIVQRNNEISKFDIVRAKISVAISVGIFGAIMEYLFPAVKLRAFLFGTTITLSAIFVLIGWLLTKRIIGQAAISMIFFFSSRGIKIKNPIRAGINLFTAVTILYAISVCIVISGDRVLYKAAIEMFGASMLIIAALTAYTDLMYSFKLLNWRFASNNGNQT